MIPTTMQPGTMAAEIQESRVVVYACDRLDTLVRMGLVTINPKTGRPSSPRMARAEISSRLDGAYRVRVFNAERLSKQDQRFKEAIARVLSSERCALFELPKRSRRKQRGQGDAGETA